MKGFVEAITIALLLPFTAYAGGEVEIVKRVKPDIVKSGSEKYFCWNPVDLRDVAKYSDAVFTGKIIRLENMGISNEELGTPRVKATMKVEESWKGLRRGQEEVTIDTESLYKYNLKEGQTYIIYAYRIYDNRLSVIGCPRIKPVDEAEREIGLLGFPQYAYIEREPGTSITIRF